MTSPDYPVLGVPGNDIYQLAHIATFIAEAIARHRRSAPGRAGQHARVRAVHDIAGGWAALDNVGGTTTAAGDLPQPLDVGTWQQARSLISDELRWTRVVSLEPVGGRGWAVIGNVPEIGPVGARAATQALAGKIAAHIMRQPVAAVAPWAITQRPVAMPRVPERIDLAAFVEHLDPSSQAARAVAGGLRGMDRRTDAAVRGHFDRVAPGVQPVPAAPTPARANAQFAARLDRTEAADSRAATALSHPDRRVDSAIHRRSAPPAPPTRNTSSSAARDAAVRDTRPGRAQPMRPTTSTRPTPPRAPERGAGR